MVSEIETRIYENNVIYIPRDMWTDSKYPFKEKGTKVKISFRGDDLLIEKIRGNQK